MILSFTIPGDPVSWARPRKRGQGKGFYTAPRQAAYADVVASLALEARPRGWDASLPMRVELVANFRRGPACVKAGHDRHHFHPTPKRYDVDNLLKLVLDGLVGVALEDDGLVVSAQVVKQCGTQAYTWVSLRPAEASLQTSS